MNFYGFDPSIVINGLRLILEGWKTLRSEKGQEQPDKKEDVLEEAVHEAEKSSAEGADAEKVVANVGAKLERELGAAAKQEVLGRLSSILTAARPLDLGAFRYYENLAIALDAARQFCISTNVFLLRSITHGGTQYLLLAKLGKALGTLLNQDPRAFTMVLRRPDVVAHKIVETRSFFTSDSERLFIDVTIRLKVAEPMGGTTQEDYTFDLSLKEGSQINHLGFRVLRYPEYHPMRDFDLLIVGAEFRTLAEALFEDVSAYVDELAKEEQDFKEKLAPALRTALAALTQARR